RSKRDWSSDVCSSDLSLALATALAASLVPGASPAAAEWVRVRTPHFDLLSDGGAAAARPAAAALARFHRVLEGLLPAPPGVPDEIGRASCRGGGGRGV